MAKSDLFGGAATGAEAGSPFGGYGALAGGALGAGLSLFGGHKGQQAAGQASMAQMLAGMQAIQAEREMYNQTRQDLGPFRNIGGEAFGQLGGLYGISPDTSAAAGGARMGGAPRTDFSAFTASPDYKFALEQGQLALDRSAAARGTLMSGGMLKEAQQFGQGLASQQFGNYFNRLLSMSQIGANAAAGQATANMGFGNNIANLYGGIGQAKASGIIGGQNAFMGGLQNAGMYGMLGLGGLGAFGGYGSQGGGGRSSYTPTASFPNFGFGAFGMGQ